MSKLSDYPTLDSLTFAEERRVMVSGLAKADVPLSYAEKLAKASVSLVERKRIHRTLSISGYPMERQAWWPVDHRFVEAATEYHRLGISPKDFHPAVRATNVERLKAVGHSVVVIGSLTGYRDDAVTIQLALDMPVEYTEAAAAVHCPIRDMHDLYTWGMPDPYSVLRRALRETDVRPLPAIHSVAKRGIAMENILACFSTFLEGMWNHALTLGVTSEQAQQIGHAGRQIRTRRDLILALHPELPVDYALAMYE